MGENITQILSESDAGFLGSETLSNARILIDKIKVLFTDDVNQETLKDAVVSFLDTLTAMVNDADPQPIVKTILSYVLSGMTVLGIDPPERVIRFIRCLQNDYMDHQCPEVFLEDSKAVNQRNVESKAFATEVLL